MSKAIDKVRKKIAKERKASLDKKRSIDAVLAFSKGESTNKNIILHSIMDNALDFGDDSDKYVIAKDVTLYHEGAVVDEYGFDYIVGKGSIADAIASSNKELTDTGVETIIVNADHNRYEYDFNRGYIGDIPIDSLSITIDENGRAMLKGDIHLLKEHSVVKDMFVQNVDMSVSIEIMPLEYSYKIVDSSGNSVDDPSDEDATTVFVLEKFSISGLAIVAYPRIASTTNGVKLKDIKQEDNQMPKAVKDKAEEIINSETEVTEEVTATEEVKDEEVVTEEVKDEEVETEEVVETEEETKDVSEEDPESDDSTETDPVEALENSFKSLQEEKEVIANKYVELENMFKESQAKHIASEARVAELTNSIEELNKKFTTINSGATIEKRGESNITTGYVIKEDDFNNALGIKKEEK